MRSATGKIFFAYGNQLEMERKLDLLKHEDPTGIISDTKGLKAKIHARKFETLSGDLIPGLRAAAAPVFDLQGNLALVVTIIAGANFPPAGDETAQMALLDHCRDLTESLGGNWPV